MESPGKLSDCALWKDPETTISRGLQVQFELVDTFGKDSHWWRYLLKCRACGQGYVYEFFETIDWEGGQDPQTTTWVPVDTDEEIEAARAAAPGCMDAFTPRLRRDWPKGQDRPTVAWILT